MSSKKVLVVSAMEVELPDLPSIYSGIEITKEVIGVGKIESSMNLSRLIVGEKFDMVFLIGVAGSLSASLSKGDLCIVDKVFEADFDTTAIGDSRLDRIIENTFRQGIDIAKNYIPTDGKIHTGTSFSSDTFLSEMPYSLLDQVPCLVCDMEDASVARVCKHYNIPYIILRMVSDMVGQKGEISYQEFVKTRFKDELERFIIYFLKNIYK